jgi:hypothetical protein
LKIKLRKAEKCLRFWKKWNFLKNNIEAAHLGTQIRAFGNDKLDIASIFIPEIASRIIEKKEIFLTFGNARADAKRLNFLEIFPALVL